MKIEQALIEKYSTRVPRYTSYPTPLEFRDSLNSEVWIEEIKKDALDLKYHYLFPLGDLKKDLSLYFHIPFCFSLCYFCACNRISPADREVVPYYLEAVKKEIDIVSSLWKGESRVRQIHFGGGSPDFLTAEEIYDINKYFKNSSFIFSEFVDMSVELNPKYASREKIDAYLESGFRRISLGVQDFDIKVQKSINRIQSISETKDVIEYVRKKGCSSVNIDILYGLPNQTLASFSKTLDSVISLKPDRIALYGYAHVSWIKRAQKLLESYNIPSPDKRIQLFLLGINKLSCAGYKYIGMDHFSLPTDSLYKSFKNKTLSRNFMGYSTTKGCRVVGIGASSISSLLSGYYQNEKDVKKYISFLGSNNKLLPISKGVIKSKEDCLRGEIIEQILCLNSLDIKTLEKRWNISFSKIFKKELLNLTPFFEDGLLEIKENTITLTKKGRLFSRNIASTFDQYLTPQKKFSQAI